MLVEQGEVGGCDPTIATLVVGYRNLSGQRVGYFSPLPNHA